MPYANFSGAVCRPAAFIGCDMENGMFLESALTGALSRNCRLTGCNFMRTPLGGIDLTTDRIDGLLLTGSELKDAVVTMEQAANLAKLLGLKIV